jgi:hypothetical protein
MPVKKNLVPVLFLIFCASASAATPEFPIENPAAKYPAGEVLVYQIHYLGIPVGESRSEIKPVREWEGRRVYEIDVRVRSYPVIDLIYKVRDHHRSFVDAETLESLRYEKVIHEGRRRLEETIVYDPASRKARYLDAQGKAAFEMEVPEKVQDQLSCGYWARTLALEPGTSVFIPVNADKRNWQMEVKVHETAPLEIEGVGKFQAVRIEPFMEFQGIFIRKGKAEGWISRDKWRVPLKMKVKIPVLGTVVAKLKSREITDK